MRLPTWRRPDRHADSDGGADSPEFEHDAGSSPDPTESADPTPADEPEPDVIRASTLADVPDWATLPPMAPSLPEMPVVVSRHFDDSLVSWQPPERFIDTLGHSVSSTAPSGVVEGIAVLSAPAEAEPPIPTGPAAAGEPLTLAIPPSTASERRDERSSVSTRRLDPPWLGAPALEEPEAPTVVSDAPAPEPAPGPPVAELVPQVEPQPEPQSMSPEAAEPPDVVPDVAPVESGAEPPDVEEPPPDVGDVDAPTVESDLVGSRPLTSVLEPLVEPVAGPTFNPLVHASTPPEMPLAYLPTARLEEEAGERPLAEAPSSPPIPSPEPPPVAVPATTASLVGDRPIIDEPADPGPSLATTTPNPLPSDTPSEAQGGDLPLAGPPPPPAASPSLPVASRLAIESPEAPEAPPAADEAPPAVETELDPEPPVADDVPPAPVSAGEPPASAPAEPPPPLAPLIGQGPPMAAESAPLATAPDAASAPLERDAEPSLPQAPSPFFGPAPCRTGRADDGSPFEREVLGHHDAHPRPAAPEPTACARPG